MKKLVYILLLVSFIGISQTRQWRRPTLNTIGTPSGGDTLRLGTWKATPTAQGYGKYAEGGRGGAAIIVDNYNTLGTGSLLQALRFTTGKRYVIMDVGGYLNITFPIKVTGAGTGEITVVGQTAPGSGLILRGAGLETYESEIIITHMKIRPGKDGYNPSGLPPSDPNYEPADAIKIASQSNVTTQNIVIAHSTASWGGDGLLDLGVPSTSILKNITIQDNLFFENPDKHYGGLIDGGVDLMDNITYYRNVLAGHNDRGWAVSSAGAKVEILNSIFYYGQRSGWVSWGSTTDFINNQYISHPGITRINNTINRTQGGRSGMVGIQDSTKIYISGNTDDGGSIDLGSGASSLVGTKINDTNLPLIPASELQASLFPTVGAYLFRDPTDTRVLNDVANRTGDIIDHEDEVGGYDTISNTSRPSGYDDDSDGVEDAWATARGVSDTRDLPDFFTSAGKVFDNREYTGGTWDSTGNVYVGGTLTGHKILEWREIFWHELGGEFQRLVDGL